MRLYQPKLIITSNLVNVIGMSSLSKVKTKALNIDAEGRSQNVNTTEFRRNKISYINHRIENIFCILKNENYPIKTAIGIVLHDFHWLKAADCRHCLFLTCTNRENSIFFT